MIGILGGGIAGLSFAYFLNSKSTILEKESQVGGLGRSFNLNGISYDIGPHIIFSKNKDILNLHTSLIKTNKIRRSNKIYHKGRLIKYPFENDLASLSQQERDYCLNEFLNNPHENTGPKNMLQFFLKNFGEGITEIYLKPYNNKIWKFDLELMDTQMVERIPKPPKEDVIKSAKGIPTEGYTHQLYFHYPEKGGFQALIEAYREKIRQKSKIVTSISIRDIQREGTHWKVLTDRGDFIFSRLINCMPVHELVKYIETPEPVKETINKLKYNSMYTVVIQAKKDAMGANFTFMVPEADIIFHRISKLNFLGASYCLPNKGTTLLVEITFMPNSNMATMNTEDITRKVIEDLEKLKLIRKKDITSAEIKQHQYAYVIYDLDHRKNTDSVLNYLTSIGIESCGRFAEFEYLNSDQVVAHAKKLAEKLNRNL